MPLTIEDLKPYRGAWVKMTGEMPWMWVSPNSSTVTDAACRFFGHDPSIKGHSDFSPWEGEGILGHKFYESTDGVVGFSLCRGGERVRVDYIEELWRPAKDCVRYLCHRCSKEHEIGKAFVGSREHPGWFGLTTRACSLCGQSAKTDRRVKGVIETPSDLWKFTQDEIVEELEKRAFAYRMSALNDSYCLTSATISYRSKQGAREWELGFWSKSGHLRGITRHTPSALDWERWFDLPAIKTLCYEGSRNDNQVRWHEVKTR